MDSRGAILGLSALLSPWDVVILRQCIWHSQEVPIIGFEPLDSVRYKTSFSSSPYSPRDITLDLNSRYLLLLFLFSIRIFLHMESTLDNSSSKIAPPVDEDGPSKTQWLSAKGRTRSPPLKRVIVYNRVDKSMQVQTEGSLDCM